DTAMAPNTISQAGTSAAYDRHVVVTTSGVPLGLLTARDTRRPATRLPAAASCRRATTATSATARIVAYGTAAANALAASATDQLLLLLARPVQRAQPPLRALQRL